MLICDPLLQGSSLGTVQDLILSTRMADLYAERLVPTSFCCGVNFSKSAGICLSTDSTLNYCLRCSTDELMSSHLSVLPLRWEITRFAGAVNRAVLRALLLELGLGLGVVSTPITVSVPKVTFCFFSGNPPWTLSLSS